MKITVKQQDLSRGLSTVSHAVSSRSTLPILANILLSTDHGRLKLSATNLEIGINAWIDAEVQEEGSTTTPSKTISDLVGSLRPGQVELFVNTGLNFEDNLPNAPVEVKGPDWVMHIKGQGSNATVKGMDPAEFPAIYTAIGNDVSLDARQLREMIEYVAFAAAGDDTRPVLTAVHVEAKDERLTFAAADAFRLAVYNGVLGGSEELWDSILIPARTLTELARILPSEGDIKMTVTPSRSQVLFRAENVDLVSRLIEGTFPNFRGIIPSTHTTRCVVDVKEFMAAVKTVTPFARDSSNIARIKISPEKRIAFSPEDDYTDAPATLTIEATAEDIGSNVSTINASVDGPDQDIIFNVKYLSDVLSVVGTENVALEIVNAARPGVIKPVNGGDYIYVIMPMSTNR